MLIKSLIQKNKIFSTHGFILLEHSLSCILLSKWQPKKATGLGEYIYVILILY